MDANILYIPDDLDGELRERFVRFLKTHSKRITMKQHVERALRGYLDRMDELDIEFGYGTRRGI